MPEYTLGLFANMYPAFEGDYRGIFIRQMVRDLETRGVTVKRAVKTGISPVGYCPFYGESLRLARDKSLDLMQAEYIPHSSIIPAMFGRRDIPLVLKFHGDDARIFPFENRLNMRLTKYILTRAAHIVTGSEEMRRILVALGEESDRISTIHTGVDTEFFSPLNREECRRSLGILSDAPLFLFAGRLHPWKGIYELIEVARSCPDYTFIFLGPGKIPDHPDNCRFIGTQKPVAVKTWLNAADCIVLPTYTESVPTVVMEAFACGIPAITSDVGGCPEIVEDGKNGLLVPVRDVPALKETVDWMTQNPADRIRMGKQGRITVCECYDHEVLIQKLIRIHLSLINL